jgi:hypothetical protein
MKHERYLPTVHTWFILQSIHTHTHTRTRTRARARTRTHTRTRTHARTRTHTHAWALTETLKSAPLCQKTNVDCWTCNFDDMHSIHFLCLIMLKRLHRKSVLAWTLFQFSLQLILKIFFIRIDILQVIRVFEMWTVFMQYMILTGPRMRWQSLVKPST